MRRVLVASLLSAVTLAASAATPKPVTGTSAATTVIPHSVSTGITGPQLVHQATVHISADSALSTYPNPARMLLRLSLDNTGNPTSISVIRSISPRVDAQVVKAVRDFHWHPATLDNQNIPVDVNLIVEVQH
jgi:TonB family protein